MLACFHQILAEIWWGSESISHSTWEMNAYVCVMEMNVAGGTIQIIFSDSASFIYS